METTELQIHALDLFDGMGSYLDYSRLYYTYFRKIPSIKSINGINAKKLREWLEVEWKEKIVKKHTNENYNRREKRIGYVDLFYLLDNNLLINLESGIARILYEPSQHEMAKDVMFQFMRFLEPDNKKQQICLVNSTENGLNTIALKFKKPRLNLSMNYNDDLILVHERIVRRLKMKDKSGLILFHGLAGTGKSTYIRYLIQCINKKVIFMPPSLAENLDAPSVVNLLISNANTVFVIEDGEDLLTSRDLGGNSGISMLLNLTDGILGESLGIQVIATFNTDLRNIDKALLRKGRLTALYEFKPLSIEKSSALLQKAGIHNYNVHQPMTLADIYNVNDEPYDLNNNQRRQIGFLSTAV